MTSKMERFAAINGSQSLSIVAKHYIFDVALVPYCFHYTYSTNESSALLLTLNMQLRGGVNSPLIPKLPKSLKFEQGVSYFKSSANQ